ncbi:hypothetical protein DI396_11515 [Litorivita pollutaquae]|uniref:DUF6473 domain-containing protein n=1 Tax=Litorivita pollutaquae TaxID=2200892 RepID=A0A2V4MNQ8_9RHOB|nr:DUF6473 family protein [Litorivita pollutaquae]OUS22988.1 hypothetical protein A9Q95_01170 [Rhodobacterales bacterium 59_46_T64]PYC47179.1 hypothetical protein DI396_11515 [Litorivita pollutaquae]
MTFETLGEGALDYFPCRYGKSKLLFRGPKRRLEGDYVAFLGGSETYGKFIETPFPALVERQLNLPCVNFGWLNAGVDVFSSDAMVLEAADNARATVVQVVGAHNMSNRFYAVHPRRNDRFLQASALMRTVFREVDFTEFHFTRHMLRALRKLSPERYVMVREELQNAWVARMKMLLSKIGGKTVLLWFADHQPDAPVDDDLASDPLYVTREMIETLRPLVTEIVEVTASDAAMAVGTEGMKYSQMEAPAAAQMIGPKGHAEAAAALAPVLGAMIGG